MNKKILLIPIALCIILVLLIAVKVNNKNTNHVEELTFSHESGFYNDSFELEITAPKGSEIYYSLDGTIPTKDSIKYDGKIMIKDITDSQNLYANREDISAGLSDEGKSVWNMGFEIPDYNVDKATIIRAVYYDKEGNQSDIKTATYYVGYDDKAYYDNMGVISIITAPDNLFGYENGIYVTGKTLDESDTSDGKWWSQPANYNQKGKDWERPATIQFFDKNKNLYYSQDCGIRIQGNRSRSFVQKSFNLYARKSYDGNSKFKYDFFGTGYYPDKMTLFSGADDRVSKIRDTFVSNFVSDMDFTTMNYVPYTVFIDGEYWGVYYLTEKYDSEYFEHYYNVDKDNVVYVKALEIEEGTDDDMALYNEMSDFITSNDMADSDNYEKAKELIDIESFIEYYATEIYIARCGDWPGSNEAFWRCRKTGDGEYEDGKWRWILYDVNGGSLELQYLENDTLKEAMDSSPLFGSLIQNEEFKKQFAATITSLANTTFNAANYDAFIADYIQKMTAPLTQNLKRFYGDNLTQEDLTKDIAEVKKFMDDRYPYIVQSLYDNLGIVVEQ